MILIHKVWDFHPWNWILTFLELSLFWQVVAVAIYLAVGLWSVWAQRNPPISDLLTRWTLRIMNVIFVPAAFLLCFWIVALLIAGGIDTCLYLIKATPDAIGWTWNATGWLLSKSWDLTVWVWDRFADMVVWLWYAIDWLLGKTWELTVWVWDRFADMVVWLWYATGWLLGKTWDLTVWTWDRFADLTIWLWNSTIAVFRGIGHVFRAIVPGI